MTRFGKPPPPPKTMPVAQQALWRLTVDSFPADWLKGSDLALLTEMVRALAMCDELESRIAKCKDTAEFKMLLEFRDREARRAAALATKLRLPPQSRSDRHRAGTAAAHTARRPWEITPTDRFFTEDENA